MDCHTTIGVVTAATTHFYAQYSTRRELTQTLGDTVESSRSTVSPLASSERTLQLASAGRARRFGCRVCSGHVCYFSIFSSIFR